jgi:hypothetical protein
MMTFRPGKRSKMPPSSQSAAALIELSPVRVKLMVLGASVEVVVSRDELPMCMQTGMPASLATAKRESQ